uniref:Uncharacterized protein n=1 Tax=Populus trichocarpa TaxID=3694 RepID=A0A2K1X839_POPTR
MFNCRASSVSFRCLSWIWLLSLHGFGPILVNRNTLLGRNFLNKESYSRLPSMMEKSMKWTGCSPLK